MGTSVSQASRNSTNWSAVRATYRSEAIPVDQVVREVWRAAQADSDQDWREMLSTPIVASCLNITLESGSASQAVNAAAKEIAYGEGGSIAAELAKRAVVQSFGGANRAQVFSQAVLAEATDYLVSRDLSGYVGTVGRNKSVQDSIAFKDLIRQRVAEVVSRVGPPRTADAGEWSNYVRLAIRQLSGTER